MRLLFPAIFLLLFSVVHAQELGANYNIVVSQNGNAFVLATFSGDGAVRVQLPSDVNAPYVKGAMYTKDNGSIMLSVTGDRMATVSFRTNELTKKNNKSWSLLLTLPDNLKNVYVSVALPKTASISDVAPQNGIIMSEEDSLIAAWAQSSGLREIRLGYEFSEENKDNGKVPNVSGSPDFLMIAIAVACGLLAIALIAGAVYFFLKRKEKKFCVTLGMRNVMKALNENDVKILETVMGANGEIKRSDLDRKSGIAKSSLALSLDRLEEKGMLKVDKETTTHRVSLTEWFRAL